jgi:hypothetical protein
VIVTRRIEVPAFGRIAFKREIRVRMMIESTAADDWSETELRGLRVLAAGGAAVEEIAALTRRSQEEVLSKLVDLNLVVPQNSK